MAKIALMVALGVAGAVTGGILSGALFPVIGAGVFGGGTLVGGAMAGGEEKLSKTLCAEFFKTGEPNNEHTNL